MLILRRDPQIVEIVPRSIPLGMTVWLDTSLFFFLVTWKYHLISGSIEGKQSVWKILRSRPTVWSPSRLHWCSLPSSEKKKVKPRPSSRSVVCSQQEATKRANGRIFSPQRKKKPALVGGLGRVSEQNLPLTKKGKARFVMGDSPQTPPFHRDLSCRSAIVWPIRGF